MIPRNVACSDRILIKIVSAAIDSLQPIYAPFRSRLGIKIQHSYRLSEPRWERSDHGPAGPPKVMKTPRLAGESACPTLASKGLRFRGAGAFACQPIFLSHLDRRLQRSGHGPAARSEERRV